MTNHDDHMELVLRAENMPAEVNNQIEASWVSPATALQLELPGAYLGVKTSAGGWNAGYKDDHQEIVDEAGLIFVVSQSSFGGTYLSAKAVEGHTVEALNPDASSARSMWRGVSEHNQKVSVDADTGKMGSVSSHANWANINFGNPGSRSGIVRVTDPQGKQRYYLMGADFQGRPDSWRVTGSLTEIIPNAQLELQMAPRQLTAGTLDPNLVSLETQSGTSPISSITIDKLATAFVNATRGIESQSASYESAEAAEDFSDLTLNLLIDIAKRQPDILEGSEHAVDELGRRARLITTGRRDSGFLDSLATEEENRVNYLEAIKDSIDPYQSSSDTAHSFQFFTQQALDILQTSFSRGVQFNLENESSIARLLQQLITADQERTAAQQAKRAEILRETVMDPQWTKQGVEYRAATPGEKIEIDLNSSSPLLTGEQTYQAFYDPEQTESSRTFKAGFSEPAIAILEISGSRFVLLDARNAKPQYQRDGWDFKLLQITDWREDSLRGIQVIASDLRFGGYYNQDIHVIEDHVKPKATGYLAENDTDVTIEFDQDAGKVTIVSPYRKLGITARSDAFDLVPVGLGDTGDAKSRSKTTS
jgi:hypothetical protein